MEQHTNTDPASRSAASWNGTLAALRSRQVPDDDPRAIECLAALAFWRCKRVIDTEAAHLVPEHAGVLAELLRGGARVKLPKPAPPKPPRPVEGHTPGGPDRTAAALVAA
jgi:hypothetical protein